MCLNQSLLGIIFFKFEDFSLKYVKITHNKIYLYKANIKSLNKIFNFKKLKFC